MSFVICNSLISLTIINPSITYENTIPFQSSRQTTILGAHTTRENIQSIGSDIESLCRIITWPDGVLELTTKTQALLKDEYMQDKLVSTGESSTNRKRVLEIKSVLEQAIIYGQQEVLFTFSCY